MMTNRVSYGKPDAGKPHVRFDEGEVASATPRRGSLLYKKIVMCGMLVACQMALAGALTEKIAAKCEVVKTDVWYGGQRTVFKFQGREAWVVEPPAGVKPAAGMPWTWTIQWWTAFVPRTGVPAMLKHGYHHVMIDMFDTRAYDSAMPTLAAYQEFLVKELGFAAKTRLIGMSWGGFFSTRYALHYPQNVKKIYLDCPLLTFGGRFGRDASRNKIGPWADEGKSNEDWMTDPRMPINFADKLVAAKIPIFLTYGGADNVLEPARNSELFIRRFKEAGGEKLLTVKYRSMYGHHPHGYEVNETAIEDFFNRK